MKRCPKCTRGLPDYEFYQKKLKNGTISLRSYCKSCGKRERDMWRKANSEKDNARNNAYNKLNAEKIRGEKLKKYWPGLTGEQALLEWNKFYIVLNCILIKLHKAIPCILINIH